MDEQQSRDRERASAVVSEFERRFGKAPSGVWAAPGRVNLIGEHTDYNQGFVFPLALAQSAYVAVAPRNDDTLRLHSTQLEPVEIALSEVRPQGVPSWGGYLAGSVWALAGAGAVGTWQWLNTEPSITAGSSAASVTSTFQ